MKYRDIEYEVISWVTRDGTEMKGYQCTSKVLLENTDTMGFSVSGLKEMVEKIDFYLDNKTSLKVSRELEVKAGSEFYETLNYKGD